MDKNYNISIDESVNISDIEKAKKGRSWISASFNNFMLLIIILMAVLIVFINIFTLCPVKQESMVPTIRDNQRVLLLKNKNVKSGDIFVFETDEIDTLTKRPKNLIKRAVATGGERIMFVVFGQPQQNNDKRYVYLYKDSGEGFKLMIEDYINEPMLYGYTTNSSEFYRVYEADAAKSTQTLDFNGVNDYSKYIIEVPKDSFYALGDNRNVSQDSRKLGFVKQSSIVGIMKLRLKEGTFLEKFLRLIYRDKRTVGQGEIL